MKLPRLWVLAESYRQFDYLAKDLGLSTKNEIRYISDIKLILGMSTVCYILWGTWYRRKDSAEIVNILRDRRGIEFTYTQLKRMVRRPQ
jgi:hypothetical protein